MKHRFCMATALIGLAVLAGCGGGGGGGSETNTAPDVISDIDRALAREVATSGSISEIRAFFTSRPDLLKVDCQGHVPLHWSYSNPLPDVASSVLLELGSDPNSRCPLEDVGGWKRLDKYAIHHAVSSNSVNAVIALINYGADLNVKDSNGNTAIYKAIAVWNGKAILRVLLEAGADGSIPNRQGQTPYQHACMSYNGTAEVLAEFGYTQ